MKPRKCIRIIFAQAVPLRAAIEKEYCIDCRQCAKTCGRQAINLDDAPRILELKVGAVVLEPPGRSRSTQPKKANTATDGCPRY